MKYANFKDTGRRSVNIGDYLQFMAADYLLKCSNIPRKDIIRLGFRDIASYTGEKVTLPFCYSIIDFVSEGKINISPCIKPVFFAVTLSTVDQFMDINEFLNDNYNFTYLMKRAPIGCRDEFTYRIFTSHNIPAYINGCMTAILPEYVGPKGDTTLFVDAPQTLLPYIPERRLEKCCFSTQQYYFNESDINDYKSMFNFVAEKYRFYQKTAKLVITSRLHVALPMTAFGIPVILAKDNVDGRFSFIERYTPVYGKERFSQINWNPELPDASQIKRLLISHATGVLLGNINNTDLRKMERELTYRFCSREVKSEYRSSHLSTHKNGLRFDEYAQKYWPKDKPIKYAFWGISQNNLEYWQNYISARYPYAELTAVFDNFQDGELLGLPYQRPETILNYPDVHVIVCSVGAAQAARKLFRKWNMSPERYCITSDCFICADDVAEKKGT